MNFFGKLNKAMSLLENFVVGASIIAISVAVLTAVVCRHLNIVMVGGEETAQFALIWLTFWGTAICARKGIHIIMSAVLDKIPEKIRKLMVIIICLVTGIFCLILGVLGVQLTYAVFSRGQVSPALRIPTWYFYIAAPMGFFLTGIYYLAAFIKNIKQKGMYFGIES